MIKLLLSGLAALAASSGAVGQVVDLPNYRPVLPQISARGYRIDPAKGYAVAELKPGVFLITDGGYQAMFVPTGSGVVLFDAPPSLAAHIVQGVSDVTREPIVALIYSHPHVDHIGGAGLILRQRPGLTIIAERGTADFLHEVADPDRPVPTSVFEGHEIFRRGTLAADLQVGHWHSPSGDLMIGLPDRKVLMAVDAFSAGSVPFMGLDLTQDMHSYLKVFDQILARDWDVIVPGHHNNAATRDDVRQVKAYVDDVYQTAARIVKAGDPALMAQATRKYGRENSYAVARVLIDHEVDDCARDVESRWNGKLDAVDVWAPSQCRTALVYAEWDVGTHGHAPD